MTASLDSEGRARFQADSDSELTRGLCWILTSSLSGLQPTEVAEVWLLLGQLPARALPVCTTKQPRFF